MLNKCKQTLSHLLAKCPTRRGDFGDKPGAKHPWQGAETTHRGVKRMFFSNQSWPQHGATYGIIVPCVGPVCVSNVGLDVGRVLMHYDRSKCAKIKVVLFLRLLGCTHSADFRFRPT